MKKTYITFAVVLCGTLTATLFHSCEKETVYGSGYSYEIGNVVRIDYDNTEYQTILSAFNNALGTDGVSYDIHSTNKDNEMKAACDAVAARFTNLQSVYLSYPLLRITSTTTQDGVQRKADTLAIYNFGHATEMPYVKYYFNINEDEAKEQLNAIRDSIGEELYKSSRRTLIRLRTQFTNSLGYWLTVHTPEAEQFEQQVMHICDSVATAHASDTLAVEARVWLDKKGMLNNQSSQIWNHTFPANM